MHLYNYVGVWVSVPGFYNNVSVCVGGRNVRVLQ